MHQRWVHERPRPGAERLPRWDNRPTLPHQVPLLPAGVLPQVSGQPSCVFLLIHSHLFALPEYTLERVHFNIPTLNLLFPRRLSNNKEDHHKSIFVQCEKGGYRLKDNVQFHLYISTSPCGDARIFSPHEAGVEGTERCLPLSPVSLFWFFLWIWCVRFLPANAPFHLIKILLTNTHYGRIKTRLK